MSWIRHTVDAAIFAATYLEDLSRAIKELPLELVVELVDAVDEVRINGGTVHLIGNGGSAGTPSHSAGDWSKELSMRTICHMDNVSALTAWANDTAYDNVFAASLEIYLQKGDLLIAYSGSGNSENVIKGVALAREKGVTVAAITGDYKGGRGGRLATMADIPIICPTTSMERIEDFQLIINHIIKEAIKDRHGLTSSC